MKTLNVGIIGCGDISPIYLKNLGRFPATTVVSVADLDTVKAKARAAEYGVPKVSTVDELLADPNVDLVLNLTVPAAHYELNKRALLAGKHVYGEKPLAVTKAQGKELVELAASKGLYIGCAPDTVLGGGIQTCRKAIDDGLIGEVVGAQAFMLGRGPEGWHPNPEFFYKPGGGPMFDMGPYYVTALVTLLGPVHRVAGFTRVTLKQRPITGGPKQGGVIDVEIPTHITAALEFENGAIGHLSTSFDVQATTLHNIEIYGTLGTIRVPDPNTFGGPIQTKLRDDKEWRDLPLTHSFAENSRGVGVLDIAYAIENKRACRAAGSLAFHVLDVMHSIHEAAAEGKYVTLESKILRPAAFPAGQPGDVLVD